MKIVGFEKLSLVDLDGKLTSTIFTYGCNLKCAFCHNKDLVINNNNNINIINENNIIDYLHKRSNILDYLCISGGEPTLQNDLINFCEKIKQTNLKIKLDTNGTNFNILKNLVDKKLIDYVAMDIKNDLSNYSQITQTQNNLLLSNIEQSINFLLNNNIDYEFRTTLVKEFHTINNIKNISIIIQNCKRYFLQKFQDVNCIQTGLHSIDYATATMFQNLLKTKINNVYLRGY